MPEEKKKCPVCGTLSAESVTECRKCGHSFRPSD